MSLLSQGKFVPLALLLPKLREQAHKLEMDTSQVVDFVSKNRALVLRPTVKGRASKNVSQDSELSMSEMLSVGINLVEVIEVMGSFSDAECTAMGKFFWSIHGYHAKYDHIDETAEIL